MKILAVEIENEGTTHELFQPYLKAEAQKAWELYQTGIIREIYFTKEDNCAVLILECNSKEEAVEYLSTLPLVKEKLISFDVKVLTPYDGFARLMELK
jgi:hypothetical protein